MDRGTVSRVSRVVRWRAVDGPVDGVGWPVVWWVIVPVAAVSGIVGIVGRSGMVPDTGWAIASVPAAPGPVIVVDAVAPTPSPAAPAPGLVVGEQDANADTDSEGDERGCDDGAGAGRRVDDGGVVLRHVDDLRIGGLDDVDGLAGDLLDFNLLLLIAAERSGGVGLRAKALDGGSYLCLIRRHGLADRGVVVDVVRHHLKHGREGDESQEGWIETLFLRGVG